MQHTPLKRLLIIAGSDPSGGAGIQADIKTATVHSVFASTAITALTVQNTLGVTGIHGVPAEFVKALIDAVLSDIGADAIKTGMLHRAEIIEAIVQALTPYPSIPLVVDPVMIAKGGSPLLEPNAQRALTEQLLPRATIITPNIPEAEALSSISITTLAEMEKAAILLQKRYPNATIVLKGGHLQDNTDITHNLLLHQGKQHYFKSQFFNTSHTHGTGCSFASAIASNLALGQAIETATENATKFIEQAIFHTPQLGHGHGPVNHMYPFTVKDLKNPLQ